MKTSVTQYVVMIAMLIALAFGASKLYERLLVGVNQTTAERIVGRE
jgi:hypothetical protein